MYIYKITNNLNNKIYIGLKTKTVEESESYYGSGIAIKQAIKKYGKDNFTKTILERDITDHDYLQERERHYIDIYDSLNNGYNLTKGGDGTIGHTHTEEYKQSHAKRYIGRAHYYNPSTGKSIFVREAPKGFIKGQLKTRSYDNMSNEIKGRIRYYNPTTDEEINIRGEAPKGFIKGRRPYTEILKCKYCQFETTNKGSITQHYNKWCKQKS